MQRRIYENLYRTSERKSMLEAGCGAGIGTSILRGKPFIYKNVEAVHRIIVGTDKDERHISFAQQMYPYAPFDLWDVEDGPYPAKLYDEVVAVEVIEHVEDPEKAVRNLVYSCRERVWLSTPNRNSPEISDEQPRNPHHVQEFTPDEVIGMATPYVSEVRLRHWEDFRLLEPETDVTPLVYELIL